MLYLIHPHKLKYTKLFIDFYLNFINCLKLVPSNLLILKFPFSEFPRERRNRIKGKVVVKYLLYETEIRIYKTSFNYVSLPSFNCMFLISFSYKFLTSFNLMFLTPVSYLFVSSVNHFFFSSVNYVF